MANLSSIRRVRRRLAELGPPRERSPGDFTEVALPATDADVLVSVLSGEVRTVIEIGLAYGASALAIAESLVAEGAGSTRHVIIDPHQDLFGRVGVHLLAEAGWERRYELIEEESQIALPRLVSQGETFDAAFVDGSHKFHNVFVDLYYLQRLVAPGGVIGLDDCEWPSVATAADYFVQNMHWRHVPLERQTRLTIFRLPAQKADPDFKTFGPFGAGRKGLS